MTSTFAKITNLAASVLVVSVLQSVINLVKHASNAERSLVPGGVGPGGVGPEQAYISI